MTFSFIISNLQKAVNKIMKVKDTYIQVRVDEETKLQAELLANKFGVNVSQLLRMFIKNNALLNILENADRVAVKESRRKAKERTN